MTRVDTEPKSLYSCCEEPDVINHRGIYVCRSCAMVHGPVFADTPKRAFTEEEIANRRQTEPVYRNIGARTIIPRSTVDITGAPLSARTKSLYWRLSKIQRSVTSTYERNLSIARPKLLALSSTLGVPQTVTEEALLIYSRAVKIKLTMGRSIENLVAASLFISIKSHDIPRTLNEIADAAQISVKSLSKAYRLLLQELNLTLRPTNLHSYIVKFGASLNLSVKVQQRAKDILDKTKKNMSFAGKDPKGLAAAALYIGAKELNESRSQSDLSKTAHISEVTLRNRAKNLKKALGI